MTDWTAANLKFSNLQLKNKRDAAKGRFQFTFHQSEDLIYQNLKSILMALDEPPGSDSRKKCFLDFLFLLSLIISYSGWPHTSMQNVGLLFSDCLLKENERIKKKQTSGFAVIREANRPLQMNTCQGEGECPTCCAGPTSTFLISPATASLLVSVFGFIYTNFWKTEARFWVQLFRCKSRATPSNSVYLPSVHTAPNTLLPVLTLDS